MVGCCKLTNIITILINKFSICNPLPETHYIAVYFLVKCMSTVLVLSLLSLYVDVDKQEEIDAHKMIVIQKTGVFILFSCIERF